MLKKQFLLTVLSVVLLTGFFFLPENREWAEKLIGYGKDLPKELRRMDEGTRFSKRFGTEYTYSVSIAENMRKNKQQSQLVLIPPTNYFTHAGMKYHVPEPAVFYYFTGIKTVWADSREAINASLYVHVREGKILLASGADKQALKDTIASFKKHGVKL